MPVSGDLDTFGVACKADIYDGGDDDGDSDCVGSRRNPRGGLRERMRVSIMRRIQWQSHYHVGG